LIVRKVQLKHRDFIQHAQIHIGKQIGKGMKITGKINHDAAEGAVGGILYAHGGQAKGAVLNKKQLQQRRHAVACAVLGPCTDLRAAVFGIERIRLSLKGAVRREADGAGVFFT